MRWTRLGCGCSRSVARNGTRMKSADRPQIIAFGDSALLLELGDQIDLELNRRVHALAKVVRDDGAWGTPVPAYASLLVPYDPAESVSIEWDQL